MTPQGPPGTGKTHTVKGILNAWHVVGYRRYHESWRQEAARQLAIIQVCATVLMSGTKKLNYCSEVGRDASQGACLFDPLFIENKMQRIG
eukprot:scaffold50534_cov23-Tisochrysis_lutea.AAC.1